jgi:molybdate transport system ATP-binding protein
MIEVQAQFRRPQFSLDVDLKLHERVTAIFGASGSGKSTLLNIIAGITKPDTGLIKINDAYLLDTSRKLYTPIHKRNIGLVFQDARLFPHLTVEQNLTYAAKKPEQGMGFTEVIKLLEIETLLTQKPHELSGGEKQRVALGRAILSNPRLLMLDEPLASLDNRLKDQILPFLSRMTQEVNIPMIYISHDKSEIAQITQNIIGIENGKIKA